MHIPTLLAPTWHLTSFFALSSHANTSSLTFSFHDTSPTHRADLVCTTAPAFTNTWQVCGEGRELLYKVSEGEVMLKRRLRGDSNNVGTARQETNWVTGINLTEVNEGLSWWRTKEWAFSIDLVSG